LQTRRIIYRWRVNDVQLLQTASLHLSRFDAGVGSHPVTSVTRSHTRRRLRLLQCQCDIFQYWFDSFLLSVPEIEIHPQGFVNVRHICLSGCNDHLLWQSYLSRVFRTPSIRLGADGDCRSYNRHLAAVRCETAKIERLRAFRDVVSTLRAFVSVFLFTSECPKWLPIRLT